VTGQAAVVPVPATAPRPVPPVRGPRAGADHPWRQKYQGIRRDVPLWQVADR
jgi:hypothetical protein